MNANLIMNKKIIGQGKTTDITTFRMVLTTLT